MKYLSVFLFVAALVSVAAKADESVLNGEFDAQMQPPAMEAPMACSPRMPDYEECLHHGGGHRWTSFRWRRHHRRYRYINCSPRMPDYAECMRQRWGRR